MSGNALNYYMKITPSFLSGLLLLIASVGISTPLSAQKKNSFTGMLEYKITVRDTNLRAFFPDNSMFIYTNDTIVRQENYTPQLGEQVTIRHMEKNKSYLLLTTDFGNFAIPSDLSELTGKDSTKRVSKYHFSKKAFGKKVLGRKAKRMIVTHDDQKDPFEFLYYKNIANKYNDAFPEMPGLPVRYSVVTPDAVFDYQLVRISEYTPNRDLFGIPSDYERTTFDDFIEKMIQSKSGGEFSPE